MNILHVLTDLSEDESYGGPASNCLGHAHYADNNSADTYKVFATFDIKKGKIGTARHLNESILNIFPARNLSRRIPFVFQISFLSAFNLVKLVRQSDLIFIHYARELIPNVAVLAAAIFNKDCVLQTHGMVIESIDFRKKLWDFIFTRNAFSIAKYIFFLTHSEKGSLTLLGAQIEKLVYLPNGIATYPLEEVKPPNEHPRIVYMARIHKRKQPSKFVEICDEVMNVLPQSIVKIYGPDAGELDSLMRDLELRGRADWYEGAVPNFRAREIIAGSDLLILPSVNEPFPISVLEALVRGVPCLIGEDSGIAGLIATFDPSFVVSLAENNWVEKALIILDRYATHGKRLELAKFANKNFGYESVLQIVNSTIKTIPRR